MDMDGVCSAALVRLGLKKLSAKVGKIIKIYKTFEGTYKEVEGIFKSLDGFNKVIIVDIAVDQDIENWKEILLVDHHIIKRDMNSKSLIFVNPRFENEEIYQPVSYVLYKLFSRLVDMEDTEWITAMGIVGDWGYEDCMDVLKNWVKVKKKSELFKTKVGRVGDLLLGAAYELGFDKILEVLIKAKSMDELENDKRILVAYKKYEIAFKSGEKDFWRNAETFGKIVFSRIKPKYRRLGSPIINRISFESPDKAIFLLEQTDEDYKVGARYQKATVHLGELMKRCCGGGGHRAAAGGTIKIEDYGKFKKRILKELNGKL